jgi:Holliday junction resolvase RusA-like endonuclease
LQILSPWKATLTRPSNSRSWAISKPKKGQGWSGKRPRFPRFYDPSAKVKTVWRKALKKALDEVDLVSVLPLFGPEGQQQHVQVDLTFFWPHPDQKDLDNMIKFVLEAYEGRLCGNDKKVYEITAKKAHATSSWMAAKFTMVQDAHIVTI